MSDTRASPKKSPMRWVVRVAMMLAGLLVGLVVTELVFRARDDGAFPHLNCYDADPDLGVVLEPGCITRNRVATNPVTDIRINATGQRGADLPPPSDDEILVLGDSQTFGLGVNEDETFASVLGALTGRPVVNAGVPTYGPVEYLAVARHTFETRHPRTVVYVVNMANDFFEHSRPDTERHAVWDHWAVRRETMPDHVTDFPGRTWLFQSSHAFFALRQLMHQTDTTLDAARDVGLPSEGSLHDLVQDGDAADAQHEAAAAAYRAALTEHAQHVEGLRSAVDAADEAVDNAVADADPDEIWDTTLQDELGGYEVLRAAGGHPGDIVYVEEDESGRDVYLTASLLAASARLRRTWIQHALRGDRAEPVRSALDARDAAEQALFDAEEARIAETPVPSILTPRLNEMVELCAAHGAELVVVGLPLDVLVSDTEFAKYHREPTDVSQSRVLLTDLVTTSEGMGLRAIDTTDALRAAEPGAFLDGDLHMTPAGHRAVATAIRDRLLAPAPLPHPTPGLPEGRTPVPTPDEYAHAVEITVRGSSAAHCVTQRVREWLRVSCRAQSREQPTGASLVSGGHGEAMVVVTAEAATLVAPVMAGDDLEADFHWADRTQRLTVHWPADAASADMTFGDRLPAAQATHEVGADEARLCACHIEVLQYENCTDPDDHASCIASCAELYGQATTECMAQFHDDCAALLGCVRGDPTRLPSCADGRVSALATRRCLTLCAPASEGHEAVPCVEGTCTPWQGANVCVP